MPQRNQRAVTDELLPHDQQREPNEYMLVDCPIDAATPTDVPLFLAVPERGAADDLTGDRANSESDACLLHISYCKTQGADFSLGRRELKDIADDWPRPTTELHDACVAAGLEHVGNGFF